MRNAKNNQANLAVRAQVAATLILSLILLFLGWVAAYSALAGGAIATIANAFFAKRVFTDYRAQKPGKLLAQIYGAEISKLVLVAILFAAVIVWLKPLNVLALFGVFLFVHLIPFFIALSGR